MKPPEEYSQPVRVRYLGLIPARAGSKGIPRKNLQPLGGKPLLQWTIEAALGSRRLDRVLLSSDDEEAIALAEGLGCPAPFVRPPELAADRVPTVDVALHALSWLEAGEGVEIEHVVVLHPTSPFRDSLDVDAAVEAFERSGRETLLAAVPVSQHPAECYRVLGGKLVPALEWPAGATGRQGLPDFVYDTGAIYVATSAHLRERRSLHDEDSALHLLAAEHAADIDDPYELELARRWIAGGSATDPGGQAD